MRAASFFTLSFPDPGSESTVQGAGQPAPVNEFILRI
jgi:hypothetical protein